MIFTMHNGVMIFTMASIKYYEHINSSKSRSLTVRFVFRLPSVYCTRACKAFVPFLLHLLFDVIQTLLKGLFLGLRSPLPSHYRAQPAKHCAIKTQTWPCPSKTFTNNQSNCSSLTNVIVNCLAI